MPIVIQPFTESWSAALREFNGRLRAAGYGEFEFPEAPEEGRQEFLVIDGECVRGGYILRAQDFSFSGRMRTVAHYRLPLSEGVVNKAYVGVGARMLRHALAQQPLLFALGMGGLDRPLPRMLKASGWSLYAVGFYFRVERPARFLRNIRALRQSAWRRLLLDLAAWSGLGWVGIRALSVFRRAPTVVALPQETFSPFADELWEQCHARYAGIGIRTSDTLNKLYPAGDPRFLKWKAMRNGQAIGWAVALDTAMRDDKYFGNLRVGSIVDALAQPEDAPAVIAAAAAALAERGVDLIVSNQSHKAWVDALRRAGFFAGPSNFILAVSRKLAELAHPFEELHINRGDGDGPIHL